VGSAELFRHAQSLLESRICIGISKSLWRLFFGFSRELRSNFHARLIGFSTRFAWGFARQFLREFSDWFENEQSVELQAVRRP
jgi:hypothetical protein